jgi:hypothetical protein
MKKQTKTKKIKIPTKFWKNLEKIDKPGETCKVPCLIFRSQLIFYQFLVAFPSENHIANVWLKIMVYYYILLLSKLYKLKIYFNLDLKVIFRYFLLL